MSDENLALLLAIRDAQLKESVDHIAQLEAALRELADRFKRCVIAAGTDEVYATIAVQKYLALAPKQPTALDRGGEHG